MEPELSFSFEAEVWLYPGKAGWHFITLPTDTGDAIRFFSGIKAGFGSVSVSVTIGGSHWRTSVFPDKKSGSYLLPLKADIRDKEGIAAGDRVAVALTINP